MTMSLRLKVAMGYSSISSTSRHACNIGYDKFRASVLETLVAIAQHRQHGAELVYDVYQVDIRAGD